MCAQRTVGISTATVPSCDNRGNGNPCAIVRNFHHHVHHCIGHVYTSLYGIKGYCTNVIEAYTGASCRAGNVPVTRGVPCIQTNGRAVCCTHYVWRNEHGSRIRHGRIKQIVLHRARGRFHLENTRARCYVQGSVRV